MNRDISDMTSPQTPPPRLQLVHSHGGPATSAQPTAEMPPPPRGIARLRRLLADANSAVALRRGLLSTTDRRVAVAGMDFLQVALGAGLTAWAAGLPGRVGSALAVGVGAAAVTALFRAALRSRDDSATTDVATASLAIGLAIGCILSGWLALGQPSERALYWVGLWLVQAMACSALLRGVAPALLDDRAARRRTPVALVGTPAETARLSASIAANPSQHLRVMAMLRDDLDHDLERLRDLAEHGQIALVLLAMPLGAGPRIQAARDDLLDVPIRVCLVADPCPAPRADAATEALPLLELLPAPLGGARAALKRAVDLALVAALVPLISPVLLGCAVAVRLSGPGPVLFSQLRFGRNSRLTRVWKFRTMHVDQGDASGARRTQARDPRVTPVGRILRRTSMDELPQLWTVLTGEMSLVGPRPHAAHMAIDGVYYFEAVDRYRQRHRVTPGITGWAQINGSRGAVDTMDQARRRVDLDLWYVENWSPLLDLKILMRTALGGFASPRAD